MNFFTKLFQPNPGSDFSYYYAMLILAGVLILGSLVASIIYKKRKSYDFAYKRIFKKLSSRLVLMGLLFLVLTGVRYESIPYFAMRIWLYLSVLILAYLAYHYIKLALIKYPKEKANVKHSLIKTNKKEVNRYLPNKKKRK